LGSVLLIIVSVIRVEEALVEKYSKLLLKLKRFDFLHKNKETGVRFNKDFVIFSSKCIFELFLIGDKT
jgi:hypothetical protein